MKQKWYRKISLALLMIIPVFLACVMLIISVHTNPGLKLMSQSMDPFMILNPEKTEQESIPDYAGVRYTYTFTLPDLGRAGVSDLRFTALLHHMYASFTVEDSGFRYEIKEADMPHIGSTPGKYWVSIPMRPEFSGKTAVLTLTPVFGGKHADDLEFMVIRRDTLLTMILLPEDGLLLALGAFSVIAGLILAVIILFVPAASREKQMVFYIGLVTVLAGLWKLSGLPVVPLLFDYLGNQKAIWYGGTACYLLMLVLSLQMMSFMGQSKPGKTDKAFVCVSAGAAFLLLLLQITGVLELHHTVVWFGTAVALMHLFTLLKKRSGLSQWLWMFPFFLTMAADLLIVIWTGSVRYAFFFLIWTVLNLIVRGFGFIRMAVLREKALRKKEEELRDARIQSMMNQMRPHFINNTLSSVYLLCREDPEQAAKVVSDFTEYLQGNFSAISAAKPVSFREELRHTQAYLAVEKSLYGAKLNVEFDTEYMSFRLPPLTLQPIAENAVKHCINRCAGALHIVIRTRRTDAGSVITVEDNGPGFDPSGCVSSHNTLENIRQRLEMMCGGNIIIAGRDCGGAVVTITVPPAESDSEE